VTAEWGGEEGAYCLAMPVTNDLALILGREIFGYPKKMGTIFFKRQQDTVEGWTERRGVRLLEVRAQLTGRLNQEGAEAAMQTVFQPNHDLIFYTYKVFPSPTTRGFDYPPRLIRNVVKLHRSTVAVGMAELMLRSSGHDPWGEVEVVQVLGALYTKGNSLMLPGTVVAEVDPDAFAPYALMKLDSLTNE
jgi:acetoacetate decarboxylase